MNLMHLMNISQFQSTLISSVIAPVQNDACKLRLYRNIDGSNVARINVYIYTVVSDILTRENIHSNFLSDNVFYFKMEGMGFVYPIQGSNSPGEWAYEEIGFSSIYDFEVPISY